MLNLFESPARQGQGRQPARRKAELGQFMTPPGIAAFMASLLPLQPGAACRLLDAGAGRGALARAFLERWEASGRGFDQVEVDAYEIDPDILPSLEAELSAWTRRVPVRARTVRGDFIDHAVRSLALGHRPYTHAILNPPYKKISTRSHHRQALRHAGIETVNLYSGFVALAAALLQPGGLLAAIIPRSFCNGPYYLPFRRQLLGGAALRHLHLFASRDKAFKEDAVLQENVILLLERECAQGDVVVSTSTDGRFHDYAEHAFPFHEIVRPGDEQFFIHVPTSQKRTVLEQLHDVRFTLDELGLEVSTGPVVDFRLREHLRDMPEPGTVPLLYPGHFSGRALRWPKPGAKKPNAIAVNQSTRKWLYPNGWYAVVRRFSSKEEQQRVVACVVPPGTFPDASWLGFENHVNVFHSRKQGLPADLAHGVTAFLNTSAVDEQFRRFNGHTQVNATDLRSLRYPSREALLALGRWAGEQGAYDQAELDAQVEGFLS
jgi:predicted RNA methylase